MFGRTVPSLLFWSSYSRTLVAGTVDFDLTIFVGASNPCYGVFIAERVDICPQFSSEVSLSSGKMCVVENCCLPHVTSFFAGQEDLSFFKLHMIGALTGDTQEEFLVWQSYPFWRWSLRQARYERRDKMYERLQHICCLAGEAPCDVDCDARLWTTSSHLEDVSRTPHVAYPRPQVHEGRKA